MKADKRSKAIRSANRLARFLELRAPVTILLRELAMLHAFTAATIEQDLDHLHAFAMRRRKSK